MNFIKGFYVVRGKGVVGVEDQVFVVFEEEGYNNILNYGMCIVFEEGLVLGIWQKM